MEKEIMTKKEYELYRYIKTNKVFNTTYAELARTLGIDMNLVRNRILSLQKKGYLIRSGTLIQLTKE